MIPYEPQLLGQRTQQQTLLLLEIVQLANYTTLIDM
jgi:hypothetical protein